MEINKKSGTGRAEGAWSSHPTKGPTMKKLILASAVSALFAAPATALAQAKPAPAPTLDKVLEASGISVSGYLVCRLLLEKKKAGFTDRVFDGQQNSFALNQFGLTVAKQTTED